VVALEAYFCSLSPECIGCPKTKTSAEIPVDFNNAAEKELKRVAYKQAEFLSNQY